MGSSTLPTPMPVPQFRLLGRISLSVFKALDAALMLTRSLAIGTRPLRAATSIEAAPSIGNGEVLNLRITLEVTLEPGAVDGTLGNIAGVGYPDLADQIRALLAKADAGAVQEAKEGRDDNEIDGTSGGGQAA